MVKPQFKHEKPLLKHPLSHSKRNICSCILKLTIELNELPVQAHFKPIYLGIGKVYPHDRSHSRVSNERPLLRPLLRTQLRPLLRHLIKLFVVEIFRPFINQKSFHIPFLIMTLLVRKNRNWDLLFYLFINFFNEKSLR
jgi:hypothetical protein